MAMNFSRSNSGTVGSWLLPDAPIKLQPAQLAIDEKISGA